MTANEEYQQFRKFAEVKAEIYSKDMFGDVDTKGINKIFVDGFIECFMIFKYQENPQRNSFTEQLDKYKDALKKHDL